MRVNITAVPTTFHTGYKEMKFALRDGPLYRSEVEVTGAADLADAVKSARAALSENATIILTPLSHKFRGFDAWRDAHGDLLEVRTFAPVESLSARTG